MTLSGIVVASLPLLTMVSTRVAPVILVLSVALLLLTRPFSSRKFHFQNVVASKHVWLPLLLTATLLGWILLSILWTPNAYQTLLQFFKLFGIIILGCCLLMVSTSADKRSVYLGLRATLPIAALIMILIEFTFNSNSMGAYLNRSAVTLALLALCIVPKSYKDAHWSDFTTLFFIAVAIFFSNSETAKFVFPAVLIVSFVARALPRFTMWIGAAGIIAVTLLTPYLINSGAIGSVAKYLALDSFLGWGGRLQIWKNYSELVFHQPWFGAGFDSSKLIATDLYKLPDKVVWLGGESWHPHNAFLQIWVELGAIGAAITAALLASVLLLFAKSDNFSRSLKVAWMAGAALVAFGSHGIWQSWWIALGFISYFATSSRSYSDEVLATDVSNGHGHDPENTPVQRTFNFYKPWLATHGLTGVLSAIGGAGIAVLIMSGSGAPDTQTQSDEGKFVVDITPDELAKTRKNISEIEKFKKGLERYKKDHGEYPKSPTLTAAHKVLLPLSKGYVQKFGNIWPRSARGVFLYRSDGKNYKIMFYRFGDCFLVRRLRPDLIDPYRFSGPVDCSAYGVWTEGARNW